MPRAKMGRKEIPIDWEKTNKLFEKGCLGTEVAAYWGMHEDTLYRRVKEKYKMSFTEYMQQKKSRGNSILREKQYDVALEGDKSLLIWLGKQRLKQREPDAAIQFSAKSSAEKFIELMESQVKPKTKEGSNGNGKGGNCKCFG